MCINLFLIFNTMTHNFVNWEITQLLAVKDNIEADYGWYEIYNDKWVLQEIKILNNYPKSGKIVYNRDAWSFEDVRLYLLSKGSKICESVADVDNIDCTRFEVWQFKPEYEGILLYEFTTNCYEKGRNAAIIYCLNLINKTNEK